jgi:hypothetical protein
MDNHSIPSPPDKGERVRGAAFDDGAV